MDIEVRRGDFILQAAVQSTLRPVAIIGPNGSGKSTLLRTIAGAYQPHRGIITVGGACFFDSQNNVRLAPEDRRVGFLPQGGGLFAHLSVLDNVAFGLLRGQTNTHRIKRHAAAMACLETLGCADLAKRWPKSLSGGEAQKVALARALLPQPKCLLLDEPVAALDVTNRRRFREDLTRHVAETGCATILVTHDARDVLAFDADVCVLEMGRVVQFGSRETVSQCPVNEFVREFFYAT